MVRIGGGLEIRSIALMLLGTIFILLMVVTMNRQVWRKMYRLVETQFKLEG
jgi:NitT/TauT family transport system permease protein